MNRFITFEGIDGSGKTTQIKLLKNRLIRMDEKVISLREPGGTEISENIRKILLDPAKNINAEVEMMLFLAARSQMTSEIIIPTLKKESFVICDRFKDSTLAYQGFGRGLNIPLVNKLNEFATSGIDPAITFYIDINIKESIKRKKGTMNDRMESVGQVFLNEVRNGYLNITNNNPERIYKIDGNQDIETISNMIWEKMKKLYKELK